MQIHSLKRNTKRKMARQVGRGGTRGKTSGRGTKGQKARAGHKMRPEIRDFIMRLPKLRGRGKNSNKSIVLERPIALPLERLEKHFSASDTVNYESLEKKGIISRKSGVLPKVKIVSDGELSKKLSFAGINVSGKARAKIEKAGGTIG